VGRPVAKVQQRSCQRRGEATRVDALGRGRGEERRQLGNGFGRLGDDVSVEVWRKQSGRQFRPDTGRWTTARCDAGFSARTVDGGSGVVWTVVGTMEAIKMGDVGLDTAR
jgi:hypothetical protein